MTEPGPRGLWQPPPESRRRSPQLTMIAVMVAGIMLGVAVGLVLDMWAHPGVV